MIGISKGSFGFEVKHTNCCVMMIFFRKNNLHYFILYWKEMKKCTGWRSELVPVDNNAMSRSGHDEELFVVPGVRDFSLDNCIEVSPHSIYLTTLLK
jgi:hypothetical protein